MRRGRCRDQGANRKLRFYPRFGWGRGGFVPEIRHQGQRIGAVLVCAAGRLGRGRYRVLNLKLRVVRGMGKGSCAFMSEIGCQCQKVAAMRRCGAGRRPEPNLRFRARVRVQRQIWEPELFWHSRLNIGTRHTGPNPGAGSRPWWWPKGSFWPGGTHGSLENGTPVMEVPCTSTSNHWLRLSCTHR